MEVISLGHSSFKFVGKEITVVCDPFHDDAVGMKFPRASADVVTVSHEHLDHNNREGVKGEFLCFDSPGEYEIKNSEIVGIKAYHDEKKGAERGLVTLFVYEVDGIKLCHLGDLGHDLSSDQLEKIDGVDVLFIPVGGVVTIDAKKAAKVISEISPKIVVPMHYKGKKKNNLDNVDVFLKEMGKDPKKASNIKIKKKDLPEDMDIYVLTPKS
jgi:L-ascorbate metabolism protein UlaG (beta-lactamase superfamily)